MQLRTYAKNNQLSPEQIIELLTERFSGVWNKTSQLNAEILEFLNTHFIPDNEALMLPQSKELLSLPQSLEPINNSQLATATQPQSIATQSEDSQPLPLSSIPLETLVDANLQADEIRIQQLVDGHYNRVTNILGNHYDRVENQLLSSLKQKYQTIENNRLTQAHSNSASNARLAEFEQMKARLASVREQTKS